MTNTLKTNLIVGKPVEPMLVKESGADEKKYTQIIKKHEGKTFAEIKSDGYRMQVHKLPNNSIRLFTRSMNLLDPKLFPELEKQFKEIQKNSIKDSELVGIEDGIKGFNAVKQRMRGELDYKLVDKFPLQLKFFDVLMTKGKDVRFRPLYERRKILENTVSNVSEKYIFTDATSLKNKFTEVTEELGLEGLVCKDPESHYLVGARNDDWIKLKKFLNLDFVVLGVYKGDGKASKLPFAGLLLGTYNPLTGLYETISKVGISSPEKINQIYDVIKDKLKPSSSDNVIISDEIKRKTYARKVPYQYVNPKDSVLVEVDALNITRSKNWHSCGLYGNKAYSLRIPIVKKVRLDKELKDCATTELISDLYVG